MTPTFTPIFLAVNEVKNFHQAMLEDHGGLDGLRDAGLPASAVFMPQAGFGGEWMHGDLFEMAAAYLFHIVQNHPFIDGNKRTGAYCALTFLETNGVEIETDEDRWWEITLRTATGNADKTDIAAFLRSLAKPE